VRKGGGEGASLRGGAAPAGTLAPECPAEGAPLKPLTDTKRVKVQTFGTLAKAEGIRPAYGAGSLCQTS
jgi:hypothetical protein